MTLEMYRLFRKNDCAESFKVCLRRYGGGKGRRGGRGKRRSRCSSARAKVLLARVAQPLDQALGRMLDHQGIGPLVIFHPVTQQVGLETDRQTVGLAIELEEVVQR